MCDAYNRMTVNINEQAWICTIYINRCLNILLLNLSTNRVRRNDFDSNETSRVPRLWEDMNPDVSSDAPGTQHAESLALMIRISTYIHNFESGPHWWPQDYNLSKLFFPGSESLGYIKYSWFRPILWCRLSHDSGWLGDSQDIQEWFSRSVRTSSPCNSNPYATDICWMQLYAGCVDRDWLCVEIAPIKFESNQRNAIILPP